METEYPVVKLAEVAQVRSGFAFKSTDWTDAGLPVVKIANVKGGRLQMDGCSFVSSDTAANAVEAQLRVGDILVSMTGYVGDVARVSERDVPAMLNQRVGRFSVTEPSRLHPDYLFYVVRSQSVKNEIERLGYGSAQPNVSPAAIQSVIIPLPPLSEQRAIAQILGALDDKIELNRKMSATLEAIARALFKSWFVDFDPVRAKAEGRNTGLPAEIAALFPDSFEETAHGQLPSGWRVDSFKNAIRIFDSKRIPLSGRERAARTGPYPYYGAASVMDHIDDFIFSGVHLLIGEDGSVIRDDGTPVLQYIWGEFWVNNHAHVVAGDGAVSTEQIYMFLQQTNIQPYVTGAVQPKLNQGNLFRVPFLRAPDSILSCFAEIVSPLFERIRLAFDESRTLAALRDALLPKLMSGELRVGEAERVLAASA